MLSLFQQEKVSLAHDFDSHLSFPTNENRMKKHPYRQKYTTLSRVGHILDFEALAQKGKECVSIYCSERSKAPDLSLRPQCDRNH